VVDTLRQGLPLAQRYRDHPLTGEYRGFRECHIQPDWLLIYLIENDVLTLTLVDTGSHADMFGNSLYTRGGRSTVERPPRVPLSSRPA